jgi:cell volume regulation protein A
LHGIEHTIFLGALLVAVSIIAGMFSSRLGAPLLLVFLGLGMVAGEDGPGHIIFSDFQLTYLVGSVALAIILFDGGLRTPRASFKLAMWPAFSLASLGVLVTAVIAAGFAATFLDLSPLQGLLVGAIIASTDAAAVFLLLHARGTELSKRVSATLELESGINDPMAVFLTIACVQLLTIPGMTLGWHLPLSFFMQMGGGVLIGGAGGFFMLWLINKIEIAPGLYPILAGAIALMIFAGAQLLDTSGYVAVYLAGLILGNNKHRASAVISRFHDGLAWLSQIGMFLLLGLLATPHDMLKEIAPALIVGAGLIVVARPLAVWLCLLPFEFTWREKLFISWVGLRGAVPIFLASIPVIAHVPEAHVYFNVAFVVVLASLAIQGWTVTAAARFLGLALPPAPEQERQEINMPPSADREAASWRVAAGSPALDIPFQDLPVPRRTRIIAVIREGTVMKRETLDKLHPDDYVIALCPPEQLVVLDKLFAEPPKKRRLMWEDELGEFVLEASAKFGDVCDQYGLPCELPDRARTLEEVLVERLPSAFVIGDRIKHDAIELVVRSLEKGRITQVGLELEAEIERLPVLRIWRRIKMMANAR